jgi:2-amino-4-hydroxy-6-hydroxymethyldihydropteridine diphosphokinase
MKPAYSELVLALGSNIGNKKDNLLNALRSLEFNFGVPVAKSNSYESIPVDFIHQPSFINLVVLYKIKSPKNPYDILQATQKIEKSLGRKKVIPKGPRNIDIDILYLDNLDVKSRQLTIPHPQIMYRDFVIYPLQELEHCTRRIDIPRPSKSLINNLRLCSLNV